MKEATPPGFLRLPAELRYKIFAPLVPLGHTFVIGRAAHASNIGQVRKLQTEGVPSARAELTKFILISRVISTEILNLLYGCNTIAFYDPWLIETFVVRIGPTNLARISHVIVQAGCLNRQHNTASATTLFSIISSCFSNLQTLRIVGVGRGNTRHGRYDPMLWLPAHLDRLEFITSLPGVLKHARVYCDRHEQNSRLLCNNAEYRVEWDELEVDITNAREDAKAYKKNEKKREAARAGGDMDGSEDLSFPVTVQARRKRPKITPPYQWRC